MTLPSYHSKAQILSQSQSQIVSGFDHTMSRQSESSIIGVKVLAADSQKYSIMDDTKSDLYKSLNDRAAMSFDLSGKM